MSASTVREVHAAPGSPATLGRVLRDLGSTLLETAVGRLDPLARIDAVTIHDPVDSQPPLPGSLVLGVGVRDAEETAGVLEDLARQHCVALVVRGPVTSTPELDAVVARTGVPVLALTPGASWMQLAAMLRSLLRDDDVAQSAGETVDGTPSGDLFALANAIAAMLDAPITIEDRSSRVLAFSHRQDEADASRIETVLGRQVPERYARYLADVGVFAQLYSTSTPVYVEPPTREEDGPDFRVTRAAIAVRAGDEVLGSIWAAVPQRLTAAREQAMCDAAKIVALHLLRLRAGTDVERRLHAGLLSTALEGGAAAPAAMARLQLDRQHVVVLAMSLVGDRSADPTATDDAVRAVVQERASDALAVHLTAVHPRAAVALLGEVTYGLLPVVVRDDVASNDRALAIATDFLARVGDRLPVAIGVGPVAEPGAGLVQSRTGADRTLRVLRARTSPSRAARHEDVRVEAMLAELAELSARRGDESSGPVAVLARYDDEHDQALVATLEAWFDAFGDVREAAERLHVHPNTFRYRLRRVRELSGLDLDDPDARLAAMVQLRLMRYLDVGSR